MSAFKCKNEHRSRKALQKNAKRCLDRLNDRIDEVPVGLICLNAPLAK